MKETGILHRILPLESGTGSKGNWKKQSFVIKTTDKYPRDICITAWGNKVNDIPSKAGTALTVYGTVSSNEYQGRYYTEVRLDKIEY